MLQLVEGSRNVADIIDDYGVSALQKYMREHNPDESGPFGINASVYDRFLRSNGMYSENTCHSAYEPQLDTVWLLTFLVSETATWITC